MISFKCSRQDSQRERSRLFASERIYQFMFKVSPSYSQHSMTHFRINRNINAKCKQKLSRDEMINIQQKVLMKLDYKAIKKSFIESINNFLYWGAYNSSELDENWMGFFQRFGISCIDIKNILKFTGRQLLVQQAKFIETMGNHMKAGSIKQFTKEEFKTVKKLKAFFSSENEGIEKYFPYAKTNFLLHALNLKYYPHTRSIVSRQGAQKLKPQVNKSQIKQQHEQSDNENAQ